jgi:hypothetical protein
VNAVIVDADDDTLDCISELSEGMPASVQECAYWAFDADDDNRISRDDVDLGAASELGAYYQL